MERAKHILNKHINKFQERVKIKNPTCKIKK